MKKLLIGLLALLALGSPVTAQTLPPNTVVGRLGIGPGPAQAIPFGVLTSNLFGSLCTTNGAFPIFNATSNTWVCSTASAGTSQFIFNSWAAGIPGVEFRNGTSAAPITSAGPSIKISRTETIAAATCASNPVDNECNAALAVYSAATGSSGMQNSAIFAGASQDSGTRTPLGLSVVGRSTGTNSALATGAYIEGRRDTNTASTNALEIRSTNQTATAGTYNSAGISNTGGNWITAGGTAVSGCASCVGAAGSTFLVGYGATLGSVTDATFRDDTNSATSILINGTHATAQITGTGFSVNSAGAGSFTHVAVTGSTTPTIGMNAASANSLSFFTRGLESLRLESQVTPANFLDITAATAGGAPAFSAMGSDTNIGFSFSTKGTGQFAFATAAFGATQFLIQHTASANRQVAVTGSNGGNPQVSSTGGGLVLAPNDGRLSITGGTPTASACAGFALATGSSTAAGRVTHTNATSCVINFGVTYTNAPFCNVTQSVGTGTSVVATTSTTQLTVTYGASVGGFFYSCFGA